MTGLAVTLLVVIFVLVAERPSGDTNDELPGSAIQKPSGSKLDEQGVQEWEEGLKTLGAYREGGKGRSDAERLQRTYEDAQERRQVLDSDEQRQEEIDKLAEELKREGSYVDREHTEMLYDAAERLREN